MLRDRFIARTGDINLGFVRMKNTITMLLIETIHLCHVEPSHLTSERVISVK